MQPDDGKEATNKFLKTSLHIKSKSINLKKNQLPSKSKLLSLKPEFQASKIPLVSDLAKQTKLGKSLQKSQLASLKNMLT